MPPEREAPPPPSPSRPPPRGGRRYPAFLTVRIWRGREGSASSFRLRRQGNQAHGATDARHGGGDPERLHRESRKGRSVSSQLLHLPSRCRAPRAARGRHRRGAGIVGRRGRRRPISVIAKGALRLRGLRLRRRPPRLARGGTSGRREGGAALALLELNREFHPDSAWLQHLLEEARKVREPGG